MHATRKRIQESNFRSSPIWVPLTSLFVPFLSLYHFLHPSERGHNGVFGFERVLQTFHSHVIVLLLNSRQEQFCLGELLLPSRRRLIFLQRPEKLVFSHFRDAGFHVTQRLEERL